jgi:hypothetical protein
MIAYNGGSISNFLIRTRQKTTDIYVTDTVARAIRYANAQATREVNPSMNQEQAEGTIILYIECNPNFHRHPASHSSLDTAEAIVSEFDIVKARVRFCTYQNTMYGNRYCYKKADEVVAFLEEHAIEVEIVKEK